MERKTSGRRGLVVLALAVLAAGMLAASSAGAAGTLTRAKVKKIATKVFNQKAPTLKDKCPAGTLRFGTGCIETANHPAAIWKDAVDTCGALSRRLPTAAELWGARQLPGIDLAGNSATTAEATSNMYRDGADFGFIAVSEGDVWSRQGLLTGLTNPFRCVAPLTNA
jgi:hypothetical protein